MKKTAILIIHVNGEKVLKTCVSSVEKNSRNAGIYVLFNGTTDNSEAMLRKNFPRVKVLRSKKLIGFAESCNLLVRKSKSEYVVFLNNDTEVKKGWLENLIKTMEKHPDCVACQPKVKSFYERNKFEYAGAAGGFMDKYGYPFCRGRLFNSVERDSGQYDDEMRLFWGCGVCLLAKRDFFIKSGGFDEDFYAYAEELDFCWRANIMGKEIWYSPKSTIYHIGSFSMKQEKMKFKKEYLTSRNHLLILLKNYSISKLLLLMPFRLILEIAAALRFPKEKLLPNIISIICLPWVFCSKFYHKRKIIQKNRKVKDKNLYGIYPGSIAIDYFINNKKSFKEIEFIK